MVLLRYFTSLALVGAFFLGATSPAISHAQTSGATTSSVEQHAQLRALLAQVNSIRDMLLGLLDSTVNTSQSVMAWQAQRQAILEYQPVAVEDVIAPPENMNLLLDGEFDKYEYDLATPAAEQDMSPWNYWVEENIAPEVAIQRLCEPRFGCHLDVRSPKGVEDWKIQFQQRLSLHEDYEYVLVIDAIEGPLDGSEIRTELKSTKEPFNALTPARTIELSNRFDTDALHVFRPGITTPDASLSFSIAVGNLKMDGVQLFARKISAAPGATEIVESQDRFLIHRDFEQGVVGYGGYVISRHETNQDVVCLANDPEATTDDLVHNCVMEVYNKKAKDPDDVQMVFPTSLEGQMQYRLSFDAKAIADTSNRSDGWFIATYAAMNGPNRFDRLAQSEGVMVPWDAWASFEYDFVLADDKDYDLARVVFELGHQEGTLQFDNLVLEKLGPTSIPE